MKTLKMTMILLALALGFTASADLNDCANRSESMLDASTNPPAKSLNQPIQRQEKTAPTGTGR